MAAQDSPLFHSSSGLAQSDRAQCRSLSKSGPQLPSPPPPHQGNTITDLQDLVERHDLAPFVRVALAEYLRANHLPQILFYELSTQQQAKIQSRARELRERRFARSSGHEGAVE